LVIGPDITSRRNPRVKEWQALRKRSARKRTHHFLVEGERETLRAAEHVTIVETIVRVDRAPIDLPHVVTVTDEVFAAVSARQRPDGIAAVCVVPDHGIDGFEPAVPMLVLVVDGVEKPGNIGAMIRSADAFGAAVLASSPGTDLVNPNVVRSAQGSLFAVPMALATREEAIAWCAEHTEVIVGVPGAPVSIWDTDLSGNVSIVVGSEHDGVHPDWYDVGAGATIPMRGRADSLNASVSAAVMLAECARQRSG
jgi:TrmH family RNA methyltransferase